jgi:hypothetical protein
MKACVFVKILFMKIISFFIDIQELQTSMVSLFLDFKIYHPYFSCVFYELFKYNIIAFVLDEMLRV